LHRIIRGVMFVSQEWAKRADKTSLLTASEMWLHAFLSMFVSSLCKFPSNCVYIHGRLSCFIEYLHRKLLTANFFSYDIDSAKKGHLLDLHIKTMNFLLYNYVFNSSQKWLNNLV
jgi:hypothetical protein